MPLVNIVLPILNRPDHTEQCLRSLYACTNPNLFDLTIVDDGSNEETKQLLAKLRDELRILYKTGEFYLIHRKEGENFGPGYSRNEGAEFITKSARRGHYIYHCDNDVYYKEGWLEKLLNAYNFFAPRGVALLGASCHPFLQNNSFMPYPLSSVDGITGVGIKDAVSGYSQLMTWEIWDRFGVYHTQEGLEKKTGRSDDWEYCQRINKAGLFVGSVEPELIIPCGKTDTYGDPAVGQETFKEYEGVIVK